MPQNLHTRVLIAGATGVVGHALLQQCLADPSVAQIVVLARRPLPLAHPKLQVLQVDFAALPQLEIRIDECHIALGSTIKAAGSKAAFRAVDVDAVLAVAKVAQAAGCQKLAVVSALESNAKSPVFYSRVKGEMEDGLRAMNFAQLVLARPSIIDGDRAALGQPQRRAEDITLRVMKRLGRLIPPAFAPISGDTIAHAMRWQLGQGAAGVQVLTSGQMQKLKTQALA